MKKILKNKILQLLLMMITGVLMGWFIFKSDNKTANDLSQQKGEETTYTCSMHPQIRQNKPGKCPICGMDLIPVAQKSDNGKSSPFVHTMSTEAIALANVQTQKVKFVSAEHEINLTGKISVNEQLIAVITANYSGRIEKLFIDFTGQSVSKSQKLATIYSPDLVTAQKELIEAAKFKDINAALYNAAKEKLRLWKITEYQITEIEKSGVVLTEFDVFADQSGVVMRRDITKGDYVDKGSVLFEIADLNKVWLLLDAYESDLPFLKTGQKINFTVSSVPGKEFSTSVSFIDPLINSQTRTASVRAVVENTQQLLKPEMFVKGKIKASLSLKEKSLVIPNTSLLWTGKRSVVYVKLPDTEFPAFEMREITLGTSLGQYYIVEEGLAEGEEIVTNGVFAIDAAAQLIGNYSMMNRTTGNTIATPEKFTTQLTDFVNQYFELKNSLIQSDFHLSQSNAKNLEFAINQIEMKLLNDEEHIVWMKHNSILKKQIEFLIKTKDINEQRKIFAPLSKQLMEIVETFRINRDNIFIAFCPMALGDTGAYWISEFEEIQNPYFGDKMLKCGDVKNTIKTKGTQKPNTNQHQGHQH